MTDEEIAEQENFMMTVEGRTDVEPLPSDRHQIHLAVHQNALGTDGDEIIEEHMRKHEEMIMRGIQAPASPESIEPAMQPAIEQANVALQQPQQPQPPQQQQQQPQPGSPEEAALMESLMEFTGGV